MSLCSGIAMRSSTSKRPPQRCRVAGPVTTTRQLVTRGLNFSKRRTCLATSDRISPERSQCRKAISRDLHVDHFAWNGKSYASLSQIAKAMTGTAWNGHRFFGLRASTSARAAQARRGLVSEATARPNVASDTLKIAMVDAGRVPKPHLRLSRRLLPPTSDDRGLRRLIGDDRAATERDFAGRAVERDPVALADLPAVEGR